MKTQVGMWIDHREANIVFLSSAGEKTRQIKSDVEKRLRRSGDSPSNGSYETQMVPASDQRERGYMDHLANYYEEVFLSAHGADTVFIFGPGEAKGELRKQFQKRHFSERIVGFESANKMTPRQVSEKVRNFYRTTPAILLRNGDCY
jgi:hypothetical protein